MLFNNQIRVTVISASYYLNKNEIILDVFREKLFFSIDTHTINYTINMYLSLLQLYTTMYKCNNYGLDCYAL